jgi:hypothetical protein
MVAVADASSSSPAFFFFLPMGVLNDLIDVICSPASLGDDIDHFFGGSSNLDGDCHTLVLTVFVVGIVLLGVYVLGTVFGCLKSCTGIMVDIGILHPKSSQYPPPEKDRRGRKVQRRDYRKLQPGEWSKSRQIVEKYKAVKMRQLKQPEKPHAD